MWLFVVGGGRYLFYLHKNLSKMAKGFFLKTKKNKIQSSLKVTSMMKRVISRTQCSCGAKFFGHKPEVKQLTDVEAKRKLEENLEKMQKKINRLGDNYEVLSAENVKETVDNDKTSHILSGFGQV
jgi:hypothetical protein